MFMSALISVFMFVFTSVFMSVLMFVFMAVLMSVGVRFSVFGFILLMSMGGAFVNAEFHPFDSLPFLPVKVHVKVADIEL